MQESIAKDQDRIPGTLSGFQRVIFRGSLRRLNFAAELTEKQPGEPGVSRELSAFGFVIRTTYEKTACGMYSDGLPDGGAADAAG
jgi:hypothetical protein